MNSEFTWKLSLLIGLALMVLYIFLKPAIELAITGGVKDVAGGYKQVDLKSMSTFVFDGTNGTISDVPEKWRQLDGQKVIFYGEMWEPEGAGPTVEKFQLVYSIAKCCFSGPPQIQHFVHSAAQPGAKLGYYEGTVEVKGVLHVNVKKDSGAVTSVFQLDVESVTPIR